MRGLRAVLGDAWRLSLPFFRSEERWVARGLLASIVILNLCLVGMNVVLNYWNGAFYDSLQNKDWTAFINLLLFWRSGDEGFMPGFTPIVAVYLPVAIYRTYLNQLLQIRWRRWMTEHLLADWLSDRAYYSISLTQHAGSQGSDNPDQRIAEDLQKFTEDTLRLGLGLISNVFSLANFAVILWGLSGIFTLFGYSIPGYMLWAALLYAIVGTTLTHFVGRPLAALSFAQQKVEADFRYALMRVRDNTEGVALLGGERAENRFLLDRFAALVLNFRRIMTRQKWLNAMVNGYEQVAAIFPIVLAAPRYFAGQIPLGGLMRTAGAFARVQNSLSWFVEQYISLADWRATVDRLAGFQRAIASARALAGTGVRLAEVQSGEIRADGMRLVLPDGSALMDGGLVELPRGRSTVISGRSGSGKSTLFRALAGIWPFGSGTVERPPGRYLFLPQRPYIPLGTLRHALTYPAAPESIGEAEIRDALVTTGLQALTGDLDSDVNWGQRLSGGEQQRLAVARALLLKPDWLFLDEATASLDPEAEAALYRAVRSKLPDTTVISIAHRPAVASFHEQALVFQREPGGGGVLRPAQPATMASTAVP